MGELNITIGTCSEEGPGRVAAPPSPLLAVPNVTAINGQCTNCILLDVAL